jgi:hypothetical protein
VLLTLGAVVVGAAIGLSLPARSTRFARPRLRWWPALVAGIAGQVVASQLTGHAAVLFAMEGLGCLVAFGCANLHLTGMGVLTIGLGLNLLATTINAGMPVSARAMRAIDLPPDAELTGARHVESSSDELTVLGDIIPVQGQIVSYGDLIIAVAVADVIAHVTRRQRRQRSISTARPDHDWGTAPSPVPSSASQYSASPDADAPRTVVAATSAPASHNR